MDKKNCIFLYRITMEEIIKKVYDEDNIMLVYKHIIKNIDNIKNNWNV